MNEVIYLEPDDEITAVVERVKTSRALVVAFVIPRGSALAQSTINLKILKRSAESLQKEVCLISGDRITRNLASQVGITVYSKVNEIEKTPPVHLPERVTEEVATAAGNIRVNNYSYAKMSDEPTLERPDLSQPEDVQPLANQEEENNVPIKEPMEPEPVYHDPAPPQSEEKPKVVEKQMAPQNMVRKKRNNKKRWLLLLVAAMVVVVLAGLFLPSASVTILLKTEAYSQESSITVDRNQKTINQAGLIIPGTVVDIENEQTKSFTATGKKDSGTKATGTMTVYNSYDVTIHKFTKGTKFSGGGISFIANDDFSVAAAQISLSGGNLSVTPGEGDVAVTAENNGDNYNVAAADYTVVGAPSKITAKGTKMAGGVTKQVTIVQEKDIDDANNQLKQDITGVTVKALLDKVSQAGLSAVESGVVSETVTVSNTKNVGDEADKFDSTLKMKFSVIGFKDKDLRTISADIAADKLGQDKMLVNPDKSDITYTIEEASKDLKAQKITAKLSGQSAGKLSAMAIQNLIKNKSSQSAEKAILALSNVEKVNLSISPSFYTRVPYLTNRIKVVFDYGKK